MGKKDFTVGFTVALCVMGTVAAVMLIIFLM